MNRDLLDSIKVLKSDIINEPIIGEYLKLKSLVEGSQRLTKIKNKIDYLKKCDISDSERDEYFSLLNEYNNDPLIQEFKNVSEDAFIFISEIKKEIEK